MTALPRSSKLTASTRSFANKSTVPLGERYVIYKVALHADGFDQSQSNRQLRSFGDVYLLRTGLFQSERTSSQADCVLSLTPRGGLMDPALNHIIDDQVTAATKGVWGVDPDGRPIGIFIETVATIGNLPQAAVFTGILKHSMNTLCKLCCMRKYKNHTYLMTTYSSQLHSDRLSLVCFDARHKTVRECKPDKPILQKLEVETILPNPHLSAV